MSDSSPQIRSIALRGVAWSVVQNWGGKVLLFGIFVFLARVLTPAEFGLASASVAVMMAISQIAELGFGDAIKQRKNYVGEDANLPFFISLFFSSLLTVACIFWATEIEKWIDVEGMAPVVAILAFSAPLTTISLFQEVHYSRDFQFKKLAFRVLVANLIAGAAAIVCAINGAGVWSLVVQSYVTTVVSLAWLWINPVWIPSFKFRIKSLWEMSRFAWPVVAMRMLDLVTLRFFEVVLISTFGIAVYGLYAVGTRLYATLNQLLHSALNNVSLPILARVSHDTSRMRMIYERTIIVAAMLFAPIYVGFAALIPEISGFLFDSRWSGVDDIAGLLLLLGAVQSVQFMNGPYLASRGRSGTVLLIGSLKSITLGFCLLFFEVDTLVEFIQMYVLTQLAGTPLSFYLTSKELEFDLGRLLKNLMPSAFGCVFAYLAVTYSRPYFEQFSNSSFLTAVFLGTIFVIVFSGLFAVFGHKQVGVVVLFIRGKGNN